MKRFLCFLAGFMLVLGTASAQNDPCIDIDPANFSASPGSTTYHTVRFQNAGLTNSVSSFYAIKYELYRDGELIPDDELSQYIDSTSTVSHFFTGSQLMGAFLNDSYAFYPDGGRHPLVANNHNYSDYPFTCFTGYYLNDSYAAIQFKFIWKQSGNYTMRIRVYSWRNATPDNRINFYSRVMCGIQGEIGSEILSSDITTTQYLSDTAVTVCYDALPYTFLGGDSTWTVNDPWEDNGQGAVYLNKVNTWTVTDNVCQNDRVDSVRVVSVTRLSELLISHNTEPSINNIAICDGSKAGYIALNVSGGQSPYTITASKNGAVYSTKTCDNANTAFRYDTLEIGVYSFSVEDAAGCTKDLTGYISISKVTSPNDEYTVSLTPTPITCHDGENGAITTELSGTYATPLTYAWSNEATTANLSGLSAGTYTLTVTDNRGCVATINPTAGITLQNPELITNTDAVTVCRNEVGNGYHYKDIDTISWTETGNYDVVFTSMNGCDSIVTVTFTVNENPTATISKDTAICVGGTATLTLEYTGALPIAAKINDAEMTLSGNSPYSFNVTPTTTTAYGITKFVDNNDCAIQINASSATVTVNTLPVVDSITTPDANTCPFSENFSVSANVTAGSSNELTYHWTGTIDTVTTTANAAVAEVATDQCGHKYELSVYVTDANTCKSNSVNADFTIVDNANPEIAATHPTLVDAIVNNCVFTIPNFTDTIRSRATDNCVIDTIYQSPIAGTTMQPGDAAQTVTITVKDKCGNFATAAINVQVPAVLKASVDTTASFCYNTADGLIRVSVEGGKKPYSLQLNNETPVETSNATYTFSDLADGTYSIAVTDANGCSLEQNLSATVEQIQETLTVAADSAKKVYDGEALTKDSYTVTFGTNNPQHSTANGVTLLNGDVVMAAISGTITNVGTSANTVGNVTVFRNGVDVTCYYNIVKVDSILTVTRSSEMTVTCPTTDEATKTYDGTAFAPTATSDVVTGTTIQYSLDSIAWTTTAPSFTNVDTQKVYVKAINANYDTAVCNYTLTINPRKVTLTSGTSSKVYDGVALTNNNVTVTGDGWANGEGATYNVTGSQLDTGTCQNVFTTTLNNNTLLSNYDTTMVFGTLTVTPITTPITITANTDSKKYDGTRLTNSGYTYTQGVLVSGDVLTATVEGGITHVSIADSTNAVVSYKVMRGTTDVTGNYTFNNPIPGALTITKRNVILTSADSSKTYDGTALTNNTIKVTGDGWAPGEGATYTVTGTQTNYGTSNNTFSYTLNNNTTATDYNITPYYGTLTVNKLSGVTVTITGKRDTVIYDGTEHSIAGFDTVVSSTLYTANCFVCDTTASAAQTNVGTDFMELQSRHFRNVSNNFENVTFNVTDGDMTIRPAKMTVEATGYDDKYDGEAHTATVTPSVPVENGTTLYYRTDESDAWTTNVPSITDFGTNTVYVKAVNPNYNADSTSCILNVTKRDITLTSATDSKEFDNTPLQNEEITVGGDGFVGDEGLVYRNFASITACDTVDNTFEYDLKDNTKAINYNITDTILGTLSITQSHAMVVTCPANADTTKKYDGTALNPVATVSGVLGTATPTLSYSIDNGANWSTSAPSITHVADGPKTVMVKVENENYVSDTCEYTLNITPRYVTLISSDSTREYNGELLVNNFVAIGQDRFAEGEGITTNVTGSILSCGSTANVFTYEFLNNTVATDYIIDTTFGTLTVEAFDGDVTITADSDSKTYDGTALTKGTYTVTGLRNGDRIVDLAMTEASTITDAGQKANVIDAGYKIMNGDTNVTACYANVSTVNGTLIINKKNVTLISDSLSQEYNGDTLRNGTTPLKVDTGWVGTEGVICTFTGEQVLVGNSDNTFTYEANDGTNLNNYNITTNTGKLIVTNRTTPWEIAIKSKSDTVTYDGNSHTVSGFDTLAFTFNNHIYTVSGVSASVSKTSVGTYQNAITGTPIVLDAAQNDVTAQFTVTADTGNLVIEKAQITLTCPTAETSTKTYDGEALNPAATATWDGPTRSFKIEYNIGNGWSQTAPSITNIDTVEVSVRATNSNFDTATCNYTLTINPATIALTCPTADASTKTYDGEALNLAATATWTGHTVAGDYFTIEYSLDGTTWSTNVPSITNVDTVDVYVRASKANFDTATCNYTLTINKADSIVVTAKDSSKVYDGATMTNAGYTIKFNGQTYEVLAAEAAAGYTLTNGDVVKAVVTGSIKDAGTETNSVVSVTVTKNNVDNSGNYSAVIQHNGTLTVDKAKVSLVSADSTKAYDGIALTQHRMAVNSGWVAGEGITITYTGTQTIPDTSRNTFTFVANEGTNLDNYTIDTTFGILEVTVSPIVFTISSQRGSWVYDGMDHTNHIYTVVEESPATTTAPATLNDNDLTYEATLANVKITVTPDTAAHIKNYADSGVVNNFSYTIKDNANNDVSDYFAAPRIVKDTLWIVRRNVTMTSADSTKVYDGTPLRNGRVQAVGFVNFEGAVSEVTGTITHVAENEPENNTFTYELLPGTLAQNYIFDTIIGTLTITPKTTLVTVEGNHNCFEYDGNEHEVTGYTFVSDTAGLYADSCFTLATDISATAKRTNVDTTYMGLTVNSFTNTSSDFANVVFSVTDGYVCISPATMELTCPAGVRTYNGQAFAPVATCDVTTNTTISYSVNGGTSWSTTAPSITHVADGTKDVMVKAENANYVSDTCYYTLKLNPDTVTLVSASAEKDYNGLPLTKEELTTNTGWVNGEGATYTFTGTQTNVGQSPNRFSVNFNANTTASDYYIDSTFGTLTVNALEGITVTITGKSDTKTYDGQAHTVTGYTVTAIQLGGEAYTGYTTADFHYIGTVADTTVTATNVSDPAAAMTMTSAMFENTNTNFDNVTFVVVPGQMVIEPLAVTVDITGNTETFTYDEASHSVSGFVAVANPQVTPAYDVTNVVLAENSTAYAERTNAGKTYMELETTDFVNNDANYNVTFNIVSDGYVNIEKAKAVVTVNGNTNTVVYDGIAKTVHGYTLTSSNPLYDVDSVKFIGTVSDSTITETNKGVYTTAWTTSNFENIDADFDVTFSPINQAVLTINPDTIAVAITGTQVTAVYDGAPHSAQGWTAVATPSNHGFLTTSISCTNTNATVGISRTDVDTTKMNLLANQFSCSDNNYYVTFTIAADGYVAIIPDTIIVNVEGNYASVEYNGIEQSVTGYTLSCISDLISLVSDIDYAGDSIAKGTVAGTYAMNLDAADFSCNNANFYVNFNIEEDGYITIEKTDVLVTVKGHNDTVTYDGASHQISGYDITSDVDSYTAGIDTLVRFNGAVADTIAHRTHVGDSTMTMTEPMFENTDTNYVVSFNVTPGHMVIEPNDNAVVVEIKGNRDTVEYTGMQQQITGYVATTENALYDVETSFHYSGDSIATGTYAYTYWMGLESDQFTNINPDFTNVTFNVTDGLLKIDPALVTVKIVGDSAEYDYDGIEHTVTGYRIDSISNALYTADLFTFAAPEDSTASRTNAGTTDMTMAAANFTNTDTNFNVTFNVTPGAITINPIEVTVTITGKYGEYDYDGNAHTVTGYTATADNELYDVTSGFTFTCANAADTTATRTEVGTTYMNIEGNDDIVITNVDDNFTNVTFERVNGFMQIYPALTADAPDSTIVDAKCYEDHNGKVVINIHGGKKPYTFAFTEGSTQTGSATVTATDTTITMDTLAAGTYGLTITDSLLSTIDVTFKIGQPEELAVAQKRTEISCNGSVGADTLVISGGTAPYSVAWDTTAVVSVTDTFIATNLYVGTYNFTITDAHNCVVSENNIEFTSPDAIVASIAGVNVNCFENSTDLVVTAEGGVTTISDYQYTWYDGENELANDDETLDIASLTVGEHTVSVKVTDNNGCYVVVNHDVLVNPTYHTEETIRIPIAGSYELNGNVYHHGDDVDSVHTTINGCDSIVTYKIRHYDVAIHFADEAEITQSTYLVNYNLDRTNEYPVDSAFMNANVNETKTFLTYFVNNSDVDYTGSKVDMHFALYKDGELIEVFDNYLNSMMISTYYDRTYTFYGMPLDSAAGEIPGNTFQLQTSSNSSIKYFNYFNYEAFELIPNQVEIEFTEPGTYTLKMLLEERVGGQAGRPWTGIYNPQAVDSRKGPLFGGYDNVPAEKIIIAARDIDIIVSGSSNGQTPNNNPAPLSIDEYTEGTVAAYPNPTNDQLNVRVDGFEGQTAISLVDAQGRVVRTQNEVLGGAETTFTFNVSDLAHGVYFLYVRNNAAVVTKKIIVTKH